MKENKAIVSEQPQMPVLFVGHGSPMNAIENNEFTEGWMNVIGAIPRPEAILCISAHWETRGTSVTAVPWPRTLHDFGGFPAELLAVQYTAPGHPELAKEIMAMITKTKVAADEKWGLDHGSWSVLKHMFPLADVPIVQLSLHHYQPPQFHYDLAKELSGLRKKGILILGSGNMVHNLRLIGWNMLVTGFGWAEEANETLKKLISGNKHDQLINYQALGKAVQLAIPTSEHYLPLLYILGLKEENERVTFFNDKLVMGSLSMTSLIIG
jgi:4,5-DOPA dioxygenase extradiol